ncbi:hypothetical protein H0H81_002323 [Sphagnurus paluster]|uniref:Uncharacterized protein n=1 Tax=Sphagnurus paluster TaxID=117069 RepID=A0A9P7KJX2_9AGAR|nr:hypothetical protein H0H81_002323 [Sphagnurus paluster]
MARHTSQIPVSRIIVQIIAITFNLVITTSERKFDRPHVSSSATTSPSQTPVVKMVDMVREPTHDIESSGPSSTNSEELLKNQKGAAVNQSIQELFLSGNHKWNKTMRRTLEIPVSTRTRPISQDILMD